MRPLPIAASTMTNACGVGTLEVQRALQAGTSGLRQNDFEPAAKLATWIGRVEAVDESRMPEAYAAYDCRNNRLAQVSLEQDGFVAAVRRAAQHYGANRVGVFLGTTTSGILATELAYRAIVRQEAGADSALSPDLYRCRHSLFATTEFVRAYLGLHGTARRFPRPVHRAPRCSRWLPGPSLPVIAMLPLSGGGLARDVHAVRLPSAGVAVARSLQAMRL
jgi:3-oxoacyl-[acyl-carrier-protein] synthase-1